MMSAISLGSHAEHPSAFASPRATLSCGLAVSATQEEAVAALALAQEAGVLERTFDSHYRAPRTGAAGHTAG